MDIELNLNGLVSLMNGVISFVNILLFAFTIKKFISTEKSTPSTNGHTDVPLKTDLPIRKLAVECVASTRDDFGRIQVLTSKFTEDRLIKEFEKAIEQQFFLIKGICLKDLTAMLGTNQRYASYILNKYTGMNFSNFVQHARILYLIALVEQNPCLLNLKLTSLAEKAGFSSMSKFCSAFRALKGVAPSEYFRHQRSGLHK